ncbi:MAG: MarR family winged helix-turn-helix transcriptional regulator [Chloroflexi bacterium]|nr:MarR family winged helix-turn-helix transcriptional regulator [Chloroflexota bacterium]
MRLNRVAWHQNPIAGHTLSEIKVLFCVKHGARADSPGMKVSEISRILDVTSPTVTQLLKGLEEDGLVTRRIDRTDRRAVVITLTEKGDMVTKEAVGDFLASFERLIDYLGEEQSNQLADLLSKVFHYYDENGANVSHSLWRGVVEV